MATLWVVNEARALVMRAAEEGVRTKAEKLDGMVSSDERGEVWFLN